MNMIIVRLEVKPDRVNEFLQLVTFNATESRKEPGNLRFDVVRAVDNPTLFRLYEVYRDEAAVAAHQATAHYAKWRGESKAVVSTPRPSAAMSSVFPPTTSCHFFP